MLNALECLGFINSRARQLERHLALSLGTGVFVISGLLRLFLAYLSTFA